MEGGIALIILILLGVLILPIILASGTNSKVKEISNQLNMMKLMLQDIRQQLKEVTVPPAAPLITVEEKEPIPEEPDIVNPVDLSIPGLPAEAPPVQVITAPEPLIPDEEQPEAITDPEAGGLPLNEMPQEQPAPAPLALPEELPVAAMQAAPVVPAQPKIKKDLERFIGEKLMSLVGIAILVLGIFFTVKWAIDKKMIGDAGKVLIGIISGTLLIGVAHRIRKSYHAFSSILVGGGLAVLYFTVYIAFQDYHLLTQVPAFIAMVCVTLCAVVLSILYDRKELAVIAIIGGFATPFFVSNNEGNFQVLFSYMLVLNVGMFILANYKRWHLINMISYVATVLIYSGWIMTRFDPLQGHAAGGFLFASLFFLVFFGMNIIYNLRHQVAFKALEIGLLLSNTFLYFGAGIYCLRFIHNGLYQGVFTIVLALFNFVFAYAFYKKGKADKNLVYLLIGLVLTFLSLTAPIQLHGNYITLFWIAEMVLLYWLGRKSGIQLIRNTSVAVLVLAIVSMIIDWSKVYGMTATHVLPVIFNKAFITGAILCAGLWIKEYLAKTDESALIGWVFPMKAYQGFLAVARILALYLVVLLELYYQLQHRINLYAFTAVSVWIYHYLFLAVLFIYVSRKHAFAVSKLVALGIACLLVLYIAADKAILDLQYSILLKDGRSNLYYWHYLVPVLALVNLYLLVQFLHRNNKLQEAEYKKIAPWFFTIIAVLIFSSEAIVIWTNSAYDPGFDISAIQSRAVKIALPILWSICSLVLMLLGMRYKMKSYRIVSLSLFSLTIIKLFLYDISNVGQGGKIAAFIILGVILLVVSFLYQKIKGLFIDEEQPAKKEEQV